METLRCGRVTAMEDTGIVKLCLQGDAAAWERMVHSCSRPILRMARRCVSPRHEAEDVAQEVFFRVFVNLNKFRAETGSLHNWVVRIGRNLMIDRARQNRKLRRVDGSRELESLRLKDDHFPGQEHAVWRSEASRAVASALGWLAPELREALELRYMEDMTYEEMAERLSVPEGTVKSRINRARSKLARIMSRPGRPQVHGLLP